MAGKIINKQNRTHHQKQRENKKNLTLFKQKNNTKKTDRFSLLSPPIAKRQICEWQDQTPRRVSKKGDQRLGV